MVKPGRMEELDDERYRLVRPVAQRRVNAIMNDRAADPVFSMAPNVFTREHLSYQCKKSM